MAWMIVHFTCILQLQFYSCTTCGFRSLVRNDPWGNNSKKTNNKKLVPLFHIQLFPDSIFLLNLYTEGWSMELLRVVSRTYSQFCTLVPLLTGSGEHIGDWSSIWAILMQIKFSNIFLCPNIYFRMNISK